MKLVLMEWFMRYTVNKKCKIIKKKMKKIKKLKKMFFEDEFLDGVRKEIMMQCFDELSRYYNRKYANILLGETNEYKWGK